MRLLAESWHASAVRPAATSPIPVQEAPNARLPVTGSPPATSAAAARSPTSDRAPAPSRTAAASRALRPTTVAPKLGAPGLLLAAGVPPDEHEDQQRHEHGVQHGQLGHRQLADAVDVEDRAVEDDHGAVGVEGARGGHPVGRGRVQVHRGGRRGVDDDGEHEHPDPEQHPVAAQRRPDEGRGADVPVHGPATGAGPAAGR